MQDLSNYKEIRKHRKQLHMYQQDVADLLGVSRQTYAHWERHPERMPVGKYMLFAQMVNDMWAMRNKVNELKEGNE